MPTITAIADGNTTQTWADALNAWITLNNLFVAGITFIAPTLTGGFSNVAGGQTAAGYALAPWGFLYLKGLITGGTGTALTLPTGYRPADAYRYGTMSNGAFAWIEVRANGEVVLGGGSGTNLSLLSPGIKIV